MSGRANAQGNGETVARNPQFSNLGVGAPNTGHQQAAPPAAAPGVAHGGQAGGLPPIPAPANTGQDGQQQGQQQGQQDGQTGGLPPIPGTGQQQGQQGGQASGGQQDGQQGQQQQGNGTPPLVAPDPNAAGGANGQATSDQQSLHEATRALQAAVQAMAAMGVSPIHATHAVADGQSTIGGMQANGLNNLNDSIDALTQAMSDRRTMQQADIARGSIANINNGDPRRRNLMTAFDRVLRGFAMQQQPGQPNDYLQRAAVAYNAAASATPSMREWVELFCAEAGIAMPDSRASMIVADPKTGGYLAPPQFVEGLIMLLQEMSPVRSICRVQPTGALSIIMNRQVAHPAATWTGEQTQRNDQELEPFGQVEIPAHEMDARVPVSRRNLMNARMDLGMYLQNEFASQFMRAEGYAFVDGDGIAKPRGFTLDTDTVNYTTDTTGELDEDDLIKAAYVLLGEYMLNATWVHKRQTTRDVRLMKDDQGRFHWTPGLTRRDEAMILGYPYVEADAMDAVAAGKVAMMLGDFRAGYCIADRAETMYLVDPYSLSSNGMIRYSGYRYVGGAVIDPKALLRVTVKS